MPALGRVFKRNERTVSKLLVQACACFWQERARIMLLALAPGRKGSNRTGRMFVGDASGDFLFPALYKVGLVKHPYARSRIDKMQLKSLIITAAGRCAPPQNKPTRQELRNCAPWLQQEFDLLPHLQVVMALGKIGHDSYLRFLGETLAHHPFAHAAVHRIEGKPILVDSYHPSRQNTQTGVLTESMFLDVLHTVKQLAGLSDKLL